MIDRIESFLEIEKNCEICFAVINVFVPEVCAAYQ